MGQMTPELIAVLDELIALLESNGDSHWSKWMRTSKGRLQSSDFSGITHLLDAYGGMGSFNDLIICQGSEGGDCSWTEGHVEKNEKLTRLRSKAWELANAIKHNHETE